MIARDIAWKRSRRSGGCERCLECGIILCMKTETRIERGTCRIAAAVAIAVLSAAGTLWAASLPTPRIVPVDPLLDEVDAATGRMTFYSVGEIGSAAEGFEVSASIDGGAAVRAALGSDRRATVSFGAVAAGKHEIEISLAPKSGGASVCRNRYAITARAKRTGATGKRLNNFVTELVNARRMGFCRI